MVNHQWLGHGDPFLWRNLYLPIVGFLNPTIGPEPNPMKSHCRFELRSFALTFYQCSHDTLETKTMNPFEDPTIGLQPIPHHRFPIRGPRIRLWKAGYQLWSEICLLSQAVVLTSGRVLCCRFFLLISHLIPTSKRRFRTFWEGEWYIFICMPIIHIYLYKYKKYTYKVFF